MRTILDNTRFGETLLPDFHTIRSCCALGERLVQESIERYGIDAYKGAIRYNTDASAASMRAAIASLPDGVYEGSDSRRLRRRRHRARVPRPGQADQARRAARGRPQRLLAAVADLAQRDRARRADGGGAGGEAGARPVLAVHLRDLPRHRRRRPHRQRDRGRAAGRGDVLLRDPVGADQRDPAGTGGSRSAARAVAGAYGSTNLHTGEGLNPDGSALVQRRRARGPVRGLGRDRRRRRQQPLRPGDAEHDHALGRGDRAAGAGDDPPPRVPAGHRRARYPSRRLRR